MNADKPTHGLVIQASELLRLAAVADKAIKEDNDEDDPGVFVSLWPSDSDGQTNLENNNGVRVFEKNGGGR